MPRAPTNVQGTELRVRDREIFEIERFYCIDIKEKILKNERTNERTNGRTDETNEQRMKEHERASGSKNL